jgi:hypothetical protein
LFNKVFCFSCVCILRLFGGCIGKHHTLHEQGYAALSRMVKVGELVDRADLLQESKATVKTALAELGYPDHDEVGKAFLRLDSNQLKDAGLNLREINAIMAEIELLRPSPGTILSTPRKQMLNITPAGLHRKSVPASSSLEADTGSKH